LLSDYIDKHWSSWPGSTRSTRPIHVIFAVLPAPALAGSRMTAELVCMVEKSPARELFEGIPVVGEYALHRRAGVAGRVRVLTS
jgi:hypothetical protein